MNEFIVIHYLHQQAVNIYLLATWLFTVWQHLVIVLGLGIMLIIIFYYWKLKRNTINILISNITDNISNSLLIGQEIATGKNIYLSDQENNRHTLICGVTGAGKTTTLMQYVKHCAQHHHPCIFIDGKGSQDLTLQMRKIADKYQRPFKIFTLKPHIIDKALQGNIASYNPLYSGTFTEWKNRIMALFTQVTGKGQQHYALLEEQYINIVAQILYTAQGNLDLMRLLTFMKEPELIVHLAIQSQNPQLIAQAQTLLQQKLQSNDVILLLELLINSSYGYLFDTGALNNTINLKQSVMNGEIILFLLDSSAYKHDTEKLARIIINDINSSFAELPKAVITYTIFDEFASYASDNLSDSISLHRSNGLHAVIGTQSITTVGLKNIETQRIAEELLACCSTYIVMATNHDKDILRFSKMFGTLQKVNQTIQNNASGVFVTTNNKMIEEALVTPQQIRNLKIGEAFIYRKAANQPPQKIKLQAEPC